MAKSRVDPIDGIRQHYSQIRYLVILFLYLQTIIVHATDEVETSTTANVADSEANSTFLMPIAEQLVRYRRQPPRTVVKHIIRPKRVKVKRVKRPKIKYSFAEPPPQIYYKSSSKPSASSHAPIFDSSIFEDISHINMESADFEAPPSSYEAHSMDLDLYSSYESPTEYHEYKSTKNPTYTYTEPEVIYKEVEKIPTYSYDAPKKTIRKPHTKYGVPTEFVYSTGYDKPSSNSYSYHGPSYEAPTKVVENPTYHITSYESSKVVEKPTTYFRAEEDKYSYSQPVEHAHIPATKYSVPDEGKYEYSKPETKPYIPATKYSAPEEDKYVYSKPVEPPRIPATKYGVPEGDKYSYSKPAEPPRIPATKYGVPDIHIPAINLGDYNKYSLVEHQPSTYDSFEAIKTSNQHHFAEPPEHGPTVEIMYSPSYEINLPAREEHYHPSNYESHSQQYESHPPPPKYQEPTSGYQESSHTHQPPSYEPAPPQDLPINQNHKHPPYDYPKSSYEVPIYDPIPFDSSNNQVREVYPPQSSDNSSWRDANPEYVAEPNNVSEQRPAEHAESEQKESDENPTEDTHSSGTRSTADVIPPHLQRNRKRKRTKGSTATTIASTKHILDVPELQQAFENEKRQRQQQQQQHRHHQHQQMHTTDTDFNESHKVESFNNGPWNPMKIRPPSPMVTTQQPTSAINQYKANLNRPHQQHRPRGTTTTPSPPPQIQQQQPISNNVRNVEIVSIDKSRSKSYYDGILSTPKIYNSNFYRNRYRTQKPASTTSTTASTHAAAVGQMMNNDRFSKRTTKNVFDTTVFKSPLNDGDIYRNLPKNHKLF